jgi:hypothetical protein
MGRSESSTGIFTRDGILTRGILGGCGIFNREASQDAVLAASTRTASSCAYRLMAGVYAPASPRRGLPLAHRDQDGRTQAATAWGARAPAR